ncbi:MAG: nucleoside phosphorylase [Candidatus Dormibacteraeota bacterium]|nr:nucleoside phosphorylase [Candidatus Dormibacteraeota bacterium]
MTAQGDESAQSERKYHVGLAAGEVGGYVLVPGDPFRTALIATHLEGAEEKAWSREFRSFTGNIAGTPVSAVSSGIGGPSMAIAVEELVELGVHTFIRVGTCGALQPGLRQGDLVIATGSVRTERTPDAYVPPEYPALTTIAVVEALAAAATDAGARHHVGLIRSVDALYAGLAPERMVAPTAARAEIELWARAGVLASDMESATMMVVSSLRGARSGVLNLVTDEAGAEAIPHLDVSHMHRMLGVAVDAVRRLIESG